MKIFKNRGDIYFSKFNIKTDLEQRILLGLLLFIIVFSSVFMLFVGIKYDFNIKNFFAPEEIGQGIVEDNNKMLPSVEGKNNYLFLLTDKDEKTLYLSSVIQFDMDSVAYKVCNLLPSTAFDSSEIGELYKKGGINNVVSAVQSSLSVQIDYYIVMTVKDFSEFIDNFGKVNYPLSEDIRFKDNTSPDTYSLRLKSGERTLDGKDFCTLLRYYVGEKKDCRSANELALSAFGQFLNPKTAENRDELFRSFIRLSETNITIKDFSEKKDNITVLCDETTGANAYNVEVFYNKNKLSGDSNRDIKSYFIK